MKWEAMNDILKAASRSAAQTASRHSGRVRIDRLSCRPDRTCARKTLELNYRQYEIPVKGQCDIMIPAARTSRRTTSIGVKPYWYRLWRWGITLICTATNRCCARAHR